MNDNNNNNNNENIRKPEVFWYFPGGIEMEPWPETD